MKKAIRIACGSVSIECELNESPTARAIFAALPLKGAFNRWGEEIYFSIPVAVKEEPDATMDVNVGDLGYWPVGKAFCVFFGPTPASSGLKPRAASPVNIFGHVKDDVTLLNKINDSDPVEVTAKVTVVL